MQINSPINVRRARNVFHKIDTFVKQIRIHLEFLKCAIQILPIALLHKSAVMLKILLTHHTVPFPFPLRIDPCVSDNL